MFFDNAEGMVFRPPSEANSLILRLTIGCSHNDCTFCSMYRDVRFRTRPMAEINQIISVAAQAYPATRRIFLADGNALVLSNDKLLTIMANLATAFPKLSRITAYGGPRDILRKTPAELVALKAAGLAIIYLGVESGDDDVLAYVNKGVTSAEMIEAGRKVLDAGIKLSTMVILGLGGKHLTEAHALNTAKVITAINPTMLSALTLMLHEGTPLRKAAEQGLFQPLNPYEFVLELRQMLAATALRHPCIFRSNHVSNLLPLAGTLPQDKDAMLADINDVLEHFKNKKIPIFNDKGDF